MRAMAQNMTPQSQLMSTLRDDVTRGGFIADLKREVRDIEEFFLTDEEREHLKRKGTFRRWFVLAFRVAKNSLLKLTSFRRILLVVGLVLVSSDISYQDTGGGLMIHFNGIGALCLLFVIVLELKDKLLAHIELDSGRAVQRAMCPEPMPVVPGWAVWLYTRSANEVGGDLVDFLRLEGDRFGVAIGDVAGKGLAAALFMVKIQSTIRALIPDAASLGDLASRMNAILVRDGIPGKFASLILARGNSETGKLQLVNAGHMPPLIVSSEGISELPKGNVALGLSMRSLFDARDITLKTGQTLVMYSDGITEAQNESGEFYGLDRFKALCQECRAMAPQAFGERVLAAVTLFEGDARRRDDLSLVILQRSGR
jgi:hypothetical protein